MLKNSPIQKITFRSLHFYLKRDDLLHPDFSGNKARKLYYFLVNDFPRIKKVVTYGSMQSNAMYSLSVLAKIKGWTFEYYTRINEALLKNPKGNLKAALENGMKIKDMSHLSLVISHLDKNLISKSIILEDTLIIPEGGRCKEAEVGIKMLANEILEWIQKSGIKKLNIVLPSGTGTTAVFLKKSLMTNDLMINDIKIYTVPCVGDGAYLKEQFFSLEKEEKYHPIIVEPPKKYKFGKLYKELYEIWLELKKETGIEFDLLYDPIAFLTIVSNVQCPMSNDFLYIHQGGLKGNETMIERYKKKFATIERGEEDEKR